MKSSYRLHFAAVLILDVLNSLTARYAFETKSNFFLVISIISLILAGYFFIRLLQDRVGIIVNATWIALGTTSVTLASYLIYNEKITWLQALGMAFVVIGIIVTEYYSPAEEK